MILTAKTSSVRREVISAMVDNVLVEVYDSGSIKQVGKEKGKKWNGWAEEAGEER